MPRSYIYIYIYISLSLFQSKLKKRKAIMHGCQNLQNCTFYYQLFPCHTYVPLTTQIQCDVSFSPDHET